MDNKARPLPSDDAMVEALKKDPRLTLNYLEASIGSLNEDGGVEGLLAAVGNLEKSGMMADLDSQFLKFVEFPEKGVGH